MSAELWKLDAFALSEQLARGNVTPVELLGHFLGRIEDLNGSLNAVISMGPNAGAEARGSEERRTAGHPLSPLDGLPIVIKDNLVVRGLPTTWGSRLYEGRIATEDELPVARLREAGVVIVGKTNVPEFTIEGYTDNPLFGVTPNPWDLTVTPGGSSGGSVAAVASGMIPMSIGTDGGGSIRRPAAYANLVGLKTTLGRVPRGGGLPQLLLDMEVVGPLTRSVRDQALLFDVLAQPDHRDHQSLHFRPGDASRELARPPGSLRVRAVEEIGNAPLDPDIRKSFLQMVDLLTTLGHDVRLGPLPLDTREIDENWASIGQIGLARLLEREPGMRDLASHKYVEWAQTHYDAHHLLKVIESISALRNRAAQVFQGVDIIMTPTCAAMPWSTEIPFPPEIDGRPVGPRGSAVYTGWVNACGHPAISVPGRRKDGGLPIGIQFVAGLGEDELLLRLSQQIETEQGWLDEWPPVALGEPPLNR